MLNFIQTKTEMILNTGTSLQVIAWLMLGEGKIKMKPKTNVQRYRVDDGSNEWFYLGYLAKKAGSQTAVTTSPT